MEAIKLLQKCCRYIKINITKTTNGKQTTPLMHLTSLLEVFPDAFGVVSLNNKTYSVIRNTYHSSSSCFILFLLIKATDILLYSFFKSCNYELSFGNSIRIEFFTTIYRW